MKDDEGMVLKDDVGKDDAGKGDAGKGDVGKGDGGQASRDAPLKGREDGGNGDEGSELNENGGMAKDDCPASNGDRFAVFGGNEGTAGVIGRCGEPAVNDKGPALGPC